MAFVVTFTTAFIVGLILMVPGFIDWQKNSYILTKYVRNYTGYTAKFDGPVKMNILPSPQIHIEKVLLEVADTLEEEPYFFQMEAMDIHFDLVSLLKGDIVAKEMVLTEPTIKVHVNERGLYPSAPHPQKPGKYNEENKSFFPEIAFKNKIKIVNGKFYYEDKISEQTQMIEEVDVTLEASTITGPFVINGSGFYKGHETQIEMNVGDLAASQNKIVFSTNILVNDLGAAVWFDGAFETDAIRLKGNMSFGVEDVAAFFMGAELPFAEDYMLLVPPVDREQLVIEDDGSGTGPTVISEFEGRAEVTLHRNEIAFRDMKIFYIGEQGLAGDFFLTRSDDARLNYTQMDVELLKPFNFDPFKSTVKKYLGAYFKKTADSLAAEPDEDLFIPRSLVLEKTLSGSFNFEAGSFTVFDQPLKDLVVFIELGEQEVEGHAQFLSEDGGDFDLSAHLIYDEKTIDSLSGDVILSDPSMDFDVHTNLVQAPHILTNLALKTENVPLVPILVEPFDGVFTAKIKPTEFGFTGHVEGLRDSNLDVKAVYEKDASYIPDRDLLTLSVINNGKVNLDAWLVGRGGEASFWDRLFGQAPEVPAPAPESILDDPDVENLEDLAEETPADMVMRGEAPFPFDTMYNFSMNDVVLKGREYDRLFLKGRLEEGHMDLEMAEVQADDETIRLDGSIDDVQTLYGMDLNFSAETKDWRALLESWGVDMKALPFDTSAAQATGTLLQGAEGVDFKANMEVLGGDLLVTGTMAGLDAGFSTLKNIRVDLELPDYVEVMKAYYPSFEKVDVLDRELIVDAELVREGSSYDLTALKATIGPAQVTGDLAFDFSGARPSFTGALDFYALPLSDMLPPDMQQMIAFKDPDYIEGEEGLRWSRGFIPTKWMYKTDFDLQITAGDLKVGTLGVRDFSIDTKMTEGNLLIRDMTGTVSGGQIGLQGNMSAISAALGTVKASGTLSLDGVELEAKAAGFGREFPLRSCKCSMLMSFAAEGSSPASLIFSLDGQGSVSGEDVLVKGFDLQNLSDVLLGADAEEKSVPEILSEVKTGGFTKFDFMSGKFRMVKGILTFEDLIWKSGIASVEGKGEVNIPLWSLDIDNQINLVGGNNKLPLEMTIAGSIDAPGNSFIQSALANYFQVQMQTFLNDKFSTDERIERIRNLRSGQLEAIRALKGYNLLSEE